MPTSLRGPTASGVAALMASRLAALAAALLLGGCASVDDGVVSETGLVASATVTTTSLSSPEQTASTATVTMGDTVFNFATTCYAHGQDQILVLGAAKDPSTGELLELYLQAFVADPYIGLRLGDGTLVESALDGPLDIHRQDDIVKASSVRFVRELDLDTGEGEEIGLGEVEAECSEYLRKLPELPSTPSTSDPDN